VIALLGFDDLDEIVARGNATRFGLTAGVWTRDLSVAHRLADQLRVGTVWINGWDRWDPAAPFGGVKQSGYGHSYGREAVEEFTVLKSVWVNYSA
jgi:acyl-CoA reductase-like NAD-dependent aldehyde dehydrogenase